MGAHAMRDGARVAEASHDRTAVVHSRMHAQRAVARVGWRDPA
jgi:hypothetical protein